MSVDIFYEIWPERLNGRDDQISEKPPLKQAGFLQVS